MKIVDIITGELLLHWTSKTFVNPTEEPRLITTVVHPGEKLVRTGYIAKRDDRWKSGGIPNDDQN